MDSLLYLSSFINLAAAIILGVQIKKLTKSKVQVIDRSTGVVEEVALFEPAKAKASNGKRRVLGNADERAYEIERQMYERNKRPS